MRHLRGLPIALVLLLLSSLAAVRPAPAAPGLILPTLSGWQLFAGPQLLNASDAGWFDYFGQSIALDGDTLAAGIQLRDSASGLNTGAVYIFDRSPSGDWLQTQILQASDARPVNLFGRALALDGDILAVGAADSVYIFTRKPAGTGSWSEARILRPAEAVGWDTFGNALALSGDTLVAGSWMEVGVPGDPLEVAGAAYVFSRCQGGADQWGLVKALRASDIQAGDNFGYAVDIYQDNIVVGAFFEDGGPGDPFQNAGAAYVFSKDQGGLDQWGQVKILHTSDAQPNDLFGNAVAIHGDWIVIGATNEGGGPGDPVYKAGAAYLYKRDLGGLDNWGQAQILHASDPAGVEDSFGFTLDISGEVIAVGTPWKFHPTGGLLAQAGATYIFRPGLGGAGEWGQSQILYTPVPQAAAMFGERLALDDNTLAVGAPGWDGGGDLSPDYGALFVFEQTPAYTVHLPQVFKSATGNFK